MRQIIVWAAIRMVVVVCMVACGGGGSSTPAPTPTPPAISNLTYHPSSMVLNQGGGAVTISGTFDYHDGGGDIEAVTDNFYESPSTTPYCSETLPYWGQPGSISGRLPWSFTFKTNTARTINFDIFVTDSGGLKSNKLTGTFTVN
jgi:hypothetical protein